MGEAGVAPEYFLERMSPNEAADFLEGYRRRHREAWERSRVGWFMQVADTQGKEATEIFPFEWDEKPKRKHSTKKQRDELRRRAEQVAKMLNQSQNGEK